MGTNLPHAGYAPRGPSQFVRYPAASALDTVVKVELRQYRAAEFCDLLTKATGSRAQFTVDDPFRCQIAPFFPGGAPIWDWLERLHQDTGWEVEAKDEKTLLLRRRA